jgi:hypothetical protein
VSSRLPLLRLLVRLRDLFLSLSLPTGDLERERDRAIA